MVLHIELKCYLYKNCSLQVFLPLSVIQLQNIMIIINFKNMEINITRYILYNLHLSGCMKPFLCPSKCFILRIIYDLNTLHETHVHQFMVLLDDKTESKAVVVIILDENHTSFLLNIRLIGFERF